MRVPVDFKSLVSNIQTIVSQLEDPAASLAATKWPGGTALKNESQFFF